MLAAPAQAARKTETFRFGPIDVAGYEVRQNGMDFDIPRPAGAGSIVAMDADLVDASGRPIPIRRLMLHHIVFTNLGRRDATCGQFTLLDSLTKVPALAERFYAAGEERATLDLPAGYGYRVDGDDTWGLAYMVMNHRARADRAYVRYRVTWDDDPALRPVTPVWMDVRNCNMDPVYDVPGGGRPGSTHTETMDWTVPEAGRIVAGGGHVHGGGRRLDLSRPACGPAPVASSRPTWGARSHPFYNVKPVLHEPGPVHMTAFKTATGIGVRAGEPLRLTSLYDAQRPHTRVMGIMVVFFAPDASADPACGPPPPDLVESVSPTAGRTRAPVVEVPLFRQPGGRTRRHRGNVRVMVGDNVFSRRNFSVPRGATVSWSFRGGALHNATVANGPRGFSSPNYVQQGEFRQKLTVPGTYELFCALHPVEMTQRIVVR